LTAEAGGAGRVARGPASGKEQAMSEQEPSGGAGQQQSGPGAAPPLRAGPPVTVVLPPKRSGGGPWRFLRAVLLILAGLIFIGSIVLNVGLLGMLGAAIEDHAMTTKVVRPGNANETIALYAVEGVIDEKASRRLEQFYRAVADDSDVRAVLLRVDSPGGLVSASDQMARVVDKLKGKGKKVVVSMGALAASGAYYLSAPADEIYAEPTSVTGSIGVIATWLVLKGTLDKIGVDPIVMRSTPASAWKDAMSPFRRPYDFQREYLQEILNKMQARFDATVRKGRGGKLVTREQTVAIPPADPNGKATTLTITAPLNGKIYLADEARQYGLIDAIGYEDEAIKGTEKLAGLTKARVVRYSRRASIFELFQGRGEPALRLDAGVLERIQTPQFLMVWKAE